MMPQFPESNDAPLNSPPPALKGYLPLEGGGKRRGRRLPSPARGGSGREAGGGVTVSLAVCLATLAACQSSRPNVAGENSAAVALLQRINTNAHTCWTRSKDKDFDSYAVIPELDTQAGKPRILVVDKKAAHGLPKLVIEADGKPVKAAAYGPLLSGSAGARIGADLKRWTGGSDACAA